MDDQSAPVLSPLKRSKVTTPDYDTYQVQQTKYHAFEHALTFMNNQDLQVFCASNRELLALVSSYVYVSPCGCFFLKHILGSQLQTAKVDEVQDTTPVAL